VLVQLKKLSNKNLSNLAKKKNEKLFFIFYFLLFGFRFSRENRKIVFSGWLLQSAVPPSGLTKIAPMPWQRPHAPRKLIGHETFQAPIHDSFDLPTSHAWHFLY